MAHACPQCLWYSPDDIKSCPHCGLRLPEDTPLVNSSPVPPLRVLRNHLHFILSVLVIGLFVFVIYNMAAPQLQGVLTHISVIKRDILAWMVGSQGQYVDYLAIAIGSSVFVWVILWLMNKLRV